MIIWTSRQPISCAYPLDADAAEILAAFSVGKLTPSPDDQYGESVISTSSAGWALMQAGFSAGTGPFLDFSTGKKLIEISLATPLVPASSGSYGANVTEQAAFFFSTDTPLAGVSVSFKQRDDKFEIDLNGNAIATGLDTPPSLLALGFDATAAGLALGTCNLSLWMDGVPLGMIPGVAVAADLMALLLCSQTDLSDSPATGQPIGIGIRTVYSEYSGTYPAGWTDVCGNPVG